MQELNICNHTIYNFISPEIKSNMYVLLSEARAIIIDPNYNSDILPFLGQHHINSLTILLTHEHPDHTNGLPLLADRYKINLICQKKCALAISEKKNNRPILLSFILAAKDEEDNTNLLSKFRAKYKPYSFNASMTFSERYEFYWQYHHMLMVHTPGHSPGSCSILMDNSILFTGDSLLCDFPVITRFPGGDSEKYINVTMNYYRTLNKNILVLPGHGKFARLGSIL